ncbi:MAG: translation initiation factor IF-2 N-terminal domain-containing protein, partial [Opitutae bacterium]
MAVRIHTLAKEIGMENKELLDLLKERGHDVKTVSSTIDNISADALRSEFSETSDSEATNETQPEPVADSSSSEDSKKESKLPGSFLPAAAVVKSAEQVEEERRKKDEAEGKSAPEPKARPIGPKQIGPQ